MAVDALDEQARPHVGGGRRRWPARRRALVGSALRVVSDVALGLAASAVKGAPLAGFFDDVEADG